MGRLHADRGTATRLAWVALVLASALVLGACAETGRGGTAAPIPTLPDAPAPPVPTLDPTDPTDPSAGDVGGATPTAEPTAAPTAAATSTPTEAGGAAAGDLPPAGTDGQDPAELGRSLGIPGLVGLLEEDPDLVGERGRELLRDLERTLDRSGRVDRRRAEQLRERLPAWVGEGRLDERIALAADAALAQALEQASADGRDDGGRDDDDDDDDD